MFERQLLESAIASESANSGPVGKASGQDASLSPKHLRPPHGEVYRRVRPSRVLAFAAPGPGNGIRRRPPSGDNSSSTRPEINGRKGAFRRIGALFRLLAAALILLLIPALSPTSFAQDVVTVPSAPEGLTATPGDGEVTLTWQAPGDNGGAEIVRYDVSYFRIGHTRTEITGDNSLTATVDGLINGSEYYFLVWAVNSAGEGHSAVVRVRPATVPAPPTNLAARPGDGDVMLHWQRPNFSGGVAVTGYQYRYAEGRSVPAATTWRSVGFNQNVIVDRLTNGTAYAFEVRARNRRGEGPEAQVRSTPATVPSAPQNLAATPGDGEVALAWDAPADDGGSAISRYEYRYAEGISVPSETLWQSAGTNQTVTVDNLTNGTTYAFEVQAVNGRGSGTVTRLRSTPATVPSAPQNLAATPGDGEVALAWDAPADDGGSAISRYEYRYAEGISVPSETLWQSAGTNQTVTVDNLTNGTTYAFEVQAVNGRGSGTVTRLRTMPATVPSAPQNLAATPDDGEVALAWDAPADDGGSAISRYEYRYAEGISVPSETLWQSAGTNQTVTVDNLTNGTTYAFEVQAVNGRGSGTVTRLRTMPLGPPSVLPVLSAIPGNGQVRLFWNAPASDGGSAISRYEYRYAEGISIPSETVWQSAGTNQTVTVDNLTNGTTYAFEVQAVNGRGSGPATRLRTTPLGPPSAPRNLAATPDDGEVALAWNAPASDGGSAILRYEHRYAEGSSVPPETVWQSAGTNQTVTVDNLANGTAYAFEVQAVNGRGEGPVAQVRATPVGAPPAPRNLAATPDDGEVALAWDAPTSDGGADLVRYEVRHAASENALANATWTRAGLALTHTVSGLVNGTARVFEVRAVNRLGAGPAERVRATPVVVALTDAKLSDIGLSYGGADYPLNRTFEPGTIAHDAHVAGLTEITVTPTTRSRTATYEFRTADDAAALEDANPGLGGFQMSLAEGSNTVRVNVTAEDGDTTSFYRLTVFSIPAVSISLAERHGGDAIARVDRVQFVVERTGTADVALAVEVQLSQENISFYTGELERTVTFGAGESSRELTLDPGSFNSSAGRGILRARVADDPDGTDYAPVAPRSAEVTMVGTSEVPAYVLFDDDGWSVDEDAGTVDMELSIYLASGLPRPDQVVPVSVSTEQYMEGELAADSRATEGVDYDNISRQIDFHPADFVERLPGQWVATKTVSVSIVDDDGVEALESFMVVPERVPSTPAAVRFVWPSGAACSSNIERLNTLCTHYVQIRDNDEASPPETAGPAEPAGPVLLGAPAVELVPGTPDVVRVSWIRPQNQSSPSRGPIRGYVLSGGQGLVYRDADTTSIDFAVLTRRPEWYERLHPDGDGSYIQFSDEPYLVAGETYHFALRALLDRPYWTNPSPSTEYTVPASAAQLTAEQDALTAEFTSVPARHGGQPFTFELAFSENIEGLSYRTVRDSVLDVTGGEVTSASRIERPLNRRWRIAVKPDGDSDVSIALPATTDCDAAGALCTAQGQMLSPAVSASVPGPGSESRTEPLPDLTVRLDGVPATHDGSSPFTFNVLFSEEPASGYSYRTLQGSTLRVFQGRQMGVRAVKRLTPGSNRRWQVTLAPISGEDMRVEIGRTADCADRGAVCTDDGRMLSNAIGRTIAGPPSLSVADARVEEAASATLDFAVRLSRAATETVTVDYATSDGTATAGSDYSQASGTLTFAVGETAKTVSVTVLDDSHDEGEETLRLTLSNVSGGNVWLKDATATGTIENDDPMPQAWLGRFGRTVAEQVIEAVEGRMRAGSTPGVAVTLAGERIGGESGTSAAGDDPDAERRAAEARGAREAEAQAAALSEWPRGAAREDGEQAGFRSRAMSDRDLLIGSSFSVTGEANAGGTVSLWGRGAHSTFDRSEGELALDGEVTSAMIGADVAREAWSAGLLVSHSRGEGGYRAPTGGGAVSSSMTGLYPWGRYMVNERVTAWGVAGFGAGELTLTPENPETGEDEPAMTADLSLAMGAVGLRGVVLPAPAGGGPELAVKSDAMAVRTSSEKTEGLAAAEADVTRLRLGLEGTWSGLAAGGGTLAPRIEIGVRHDGGDAETGFGLDLGGGLAWSHPENGIAAEVSGRALLTHESSGFRDRGIAGSLSWDPGQGSGRGPKLTLSQTMGASAAGGADALLGRRTLAGLAANDHGNGLENRRLEFRMGYGLSALGGRFTSTPELGLALSNGQREYSLGWRLGLAQTGGNALELRVEANRREAANDRKEPEHAVGFGVTARW